MITATEQRIHDWARWSRAGGPLAGLGYKSPSLTLLRQHMGGGLPLPPLSDDEAMFVDAAVLRLKARDADLWMALVLYYGVQADGRCSSSYSAVGREMRCTKLVAQQLVSSAVAWLDGVFAQADLQAA